MPGRDADRGTLVLKSQLAGESRSLRLIATELSVQYDGSRSKLKSTVMARAFIMAL